MPKTKWYEELFATEAPARLGKYEESEASRNEVTFVIEATNIAIDSHVLDLCCGQGRHLLELHRRGYFAVGADLSGYLLSKCNENAASEAISRRVCRCDMRALPFKFGFDVVLNLLTSFGYLESDDDHVRVLRSINAVLKPHGRLLIDMLNSSWAIRNYRQREETTNRRGEQIVKRKNYDPTTCRMDGTETTLLQDGGVDVREHHVRLYSYPEMHAMLSTSGFTVDALFGDLRGSRFGADTSNMVVVATKVA